MERKKYKKNKNYSDIFTLASFFKIMININQ